MFEFRLRQPAGRLSKDLKKRKVNLHFKEDIEPQEVLLDSLAQKREEEVGFSEKKFEVPLLKKILQGFFIVCVLIILILFAKTFQFQVVEGKKFSELAEGNKFIIHQIQAERGVIYDKNLNQIVFNEPSFDLVCEIANFPKNEDEKLKILEEVSAILKKDIEELKKEIENSDSPQILISKNLDHQTLILFETKVNELPGFQIKNNTIRNYQAGQIFAHLIGYTGKIRSSELKEEPGFYAITDYVGRTGIENFYEETLRKNPGKLRIERDALGNIISREITSLPESGKSLVLWLDSDLQKKIKEELENKLREFSVNKAVGLAMDPRTGGILALVSLPDFDNNLFQKGADPEELKELLEDPYKLESLFNRAISGRYLTGSTIKPLIASAALEEKIISPKKMINCQGLITVPHQYDPEIEFIFHDWTTHGWTDMRKAIAESCNVYFYTIGGGYGEQEGLGPTKIKEYLELFSWTEKTGIDLPSEATGFVPDPAWKKAYFEKKEDQVWVDGNTYYLSIGQQYLKITPLEVVTAFSAIANGGILYQPQVVQKIVDTSAGTIQILEEREARIIRENFIDSQNLQIIREGMRGAVTYGSAVDWLNSLPVAAAAKTGTAELGNNYYHNWVTVFAPYEDPEIVLTIMIENVKGVQLAALPVAKAVLEWYFTRERNF